MAEEPLKYNDGRLERIERKIDDLSEAFVILARAEEKLATIERDRVENQTRLTKIETRMDGLIISLDNSSRTTIAINRIFWFVIAAAIGAYVTGIIDMLYTIK